MGCNDMFNMYDEEKRGSAIIPDALLGLLELVKLRHEYYKVILEFKRFVFF